MECSVDTGFPPCSFEHACHSESVTAITRQLAGGPFKPGFGLSGAVLQPDRVFLPLFPVFGSPISTLSQRVPRLKNTRSLHSTDHRFAMICSGRDDRVGEI